MNMLKIKKRSSGFTLAEMMISIGIIAIFATIILFATQEVRARARYTHAVASLEMITAAAGMYRAINKAYPDDTANLSFVSDYFNETVEPPCPGWYYDWQNWPDDGSGNGRFIKIDLSKDPGGTEELIMSKCIYVESPNLKCDPSTSECRDNTPGNEYQPNDIPCDEKDYTTYSKIYCN